MATEWTPELRKALRRPFPESAIKWKPQKVAGNRALAVAYIDARMLMERLDRVVGPENWEDTYRVVQVRDETAIECTLTILGVSKVDVGEVGGSGGGFVSLSKTGYSDAFKRAGVKFGIGRYLYALPAAWCNYDPQKQRLLDRPDLPAWAIPSGADEVDPESIPDADVEPPAEGSLRPREEPSTPPAPEKPKAKVGRDVSEIIGTHATQVTSTEHWCHDQKARAAFYASLQRMKLTKEEAYTVLVGAPDAHLDTYDGTPGDALMMLREYAVEQGRIER